MKNKMAMIRNLFLCLICFITFQNLYSQNARELSPEKHMELAEQQLSQGNCEAALQHINKTIAAQPSTEAYALRASIHECRNDLNAAITDYSVVVHQHPEDPEVSFSRGVLLYRAEKYKEAIADMQRALRHPVQETNKVFYKIAVGESGISGLSTLETMQAEIHNYIGLAFHGLAEYDSAISHFYAAITLKNDAQFFNNRALTFEKQGKYEQATADYEEALKIDENNQVAIYNLVNLYEQTRQYDKQKQILNRLGTGQKLPEIYIFKGVAAYQTGDYATAVAEYDSAIALDDENEEYFLYRGQANEKLKRYADAVRDFESAIALDANYPKAYFGLANVYFNTNKLDSARLNYDLALLYDPQYANAYMNRGIVYLRQKDLEKACDDLQMAVKNGQEAAREVLAKKCRDQ